MPEPKDLKEPRGFADEDEEFEPDPDDWREDDEPEPVEDDEDEIVRPAPRLGGGLAPAASLLDGILGAPGRPPRSGQERHRIMVIVEPANPDEPPVAPPPVLCADCGESCPYEPTPVEEGRTARVFRRPYCACERRRIEEDARVEALRRERERAEAAQKAVVVARRALVVPENLRDARFDNFDTERHTTQKAAWAEARAFAEIAARWFADRRGTFPLLPETLQAAGVPEEPPPGFAFKGTPGTGKSHLAVAVCRALAHYGILCRFENVEEFLAALRRENDGSGTRGERLRLAERADVLVLDDLGMEHIPASNPTWVRSTLYSLVDLRYRKRLPIIVTTTVAPDRLVLHYGEQGPAIIDRLSARPWLPVNGPSGRSWGRNFEPRGFVREEG